MKIYQTEPSRVAFASLSAKTLLLACLTLLCSLACKLSIHILAPLALFTFLEPVLDKLAVILLTAGAMLLLVALMIQLSTPNTVRIVCMVRQALFDPKHGNPLELKEGELLPHIHCKRMNDDLYELIISCQQSVTAKELEAAAPVISSALKHRFQQYAVVAVDTDTAVNDVVFHLSNVKVDRTLTFTDVEQMRPTSPTLLKVNKITNIDLTTSGSILCAGTTRSGKTTGIISLLIQALILGPDPYGSQITIIDPKQAELSYLPHVVTLDQDGGGRAILAALRAFAESITQRQAILNQLSLQTGDVVHWWEAGMKVSFIFIDEFVTCRSLFPKRAEKDEPYYCLAEFDAILKRIVTMGASTGGYTVISTPEASVEEGGLPAMLRAAMSTRILFRPTLNEGKLMWNADKLIHLPSKVHNAGDAWFSSTDGIHDMVSCVHFPKMQFLVYRELGRLLKRYYEDG